MNAFMVAYLVIGAVIGIGSAAVIWSWSLKRFKAAEEVSLLDVLLAVAVGLVVALCAPVLWPFYLSALFVDWAERFKIKSKT